MRYYSSGYPMPQDFSYSGSLPGGIIGGFGNFITNFMQAYEMEQQRKKEEAGMIMNLLSEFGGEVSPEQMGGIEKAYGRTGGLIKSVFQPTYEQERTQVPAPDEYGGMGETIEQISQGKLKGYRLPGKEEREVKKKKELMAAEHPYKEELLQEQLKSREAIAALQLQGIKDKIDAYQETVKEKLASAEKIAAAGNATKEQIAAATNEVRQSIANLTQQVELYKALAGITSREKIADKKIEADKEKQEKPINPLETRKLFLSAAKQYINQQTGEFKLLNEKESADLARIAKEHGYGYEEEVDTGIAGTGLFGGIKPKISYDISKVKGTAKEVPGREAAQEKPTGKTTKPKVTPAQAKKLLDEANKAIKLGADPKAVKKRLKDKYGIEVE